MSPTEILALFKYAWATFIPFGYKLWSNLNVRFKDIENKVEINTKDQSEIKADVKVLIERSKNHSKVLDKHITKQEKDMEALFNLIHSKL